MKNMQINVLGLIENKLLTYSKLIFVDSFGNDLEKEPSLKLSSFRIENLIDYKLKKINQIDLCL